jgi:hypothetical protein
MAEFAKGAVWGLCLMFIALVLVIGAGGVVNAVFPRQLDDTDPPGGRSQMLSLTDHRTGCQYLMASHGGLTPRLAADGSHMGCKP